MKILGNNGDGEEYQVVGNFIHPCIYLKMILSGLGEPPDTVRVLDLQVVRH